MPVFVFAEVSQNKASFFLRDEKRGVVCYLGECFPIFLRNFLLLHEINFVSHNHKEDFFRTKLSEFVNSFPHHSKGLPIRDIIYNYRYMSVFIVHRRKRVVFLLASCIPDLKLIRTCNEISDR